MDSSETVRPPSVTADDVQSQRDRPTPFCRRIWRPGQLYHRPRSPNQFGRGGPTGG
ncbi:hypothetical protein [Okeania sp. SIO1H5]|uniref:hypothetical protein n=1 Tax=Okeania sp. SIO1H5 TaxID=2607777 RepID=UPI00257CDD42|nr:hypothetical protein [Okeania sp. SIO1H5]